MPIDDEEWAAGRTETGAEGGHVKEKLLEYLELNETRAYTADELAKVYAREVAGDAVTGKDPEGISTEAPAHGVLFARFLTRAPTAIFPP